MISRLQSLVNKLLKLEIFRYLVVGGGAVFIDFLSHMTMVHAFQIHISVSKAISYILGAFFAFLMNRIWTFQSDQRIHKSLVKFSILYASTFCANVVMNAFAVLIGMPVIIAFAIATATSIVLNYIGQKFWVFREVKRV